MNAVFTKKPVSDFAKKMLAQASARAAAERAAAEQAEAERTEQMIEFGNEARIHDTVVARFGNGHRNGAHGRALGMHNKDACRRFSYRT